MKKILDTKFGTSSGSSTEEDPPSGFNLPLEANNGSNQMALCDFRIIRSKIKKNKAPLFKNFKGNVHCYLPYQSLLENGKEVNLTHHNSNSRLNIYMTEVSVLYAGSNNYSGNGAPDDKDKIDVRHVTKSKRNHIFLGQSIWLKKTPNKKKQGEFARGKKVEGHYIIHEIRPVHNLEHWSPEECDNESSRIQTRAKGNLFVRNYGGLSVNMWLVIARPIKWKLKEENNDYYVGLVETAEGNVPQLYQDVDVYKHEKSLKDQLQYKPVEIVQCDKVVARFHIAPCIELGKASNNNE